MTTRDSISYCGIDFGTTNSSLSIVNNSLPEIVPIDSESPNPNTLKSLIYINPEHNSSIGSKAIKNYLHDLEIYPARIPRLEFTGRYIKTFGPSTGGGVGPVIFVPEIVEIDDSGRGRLLQSLKSVLVSKTFTGTNIFGKFYSLEDLLTLILSEIKQNAEKVVGANLDSVVLGRPVRYVGSGDESTALDRMKLIARNSGFKNVEFELEPIGAALNYGLNIKTDQKVLVFDFGGGTLDVCVMKLPEKKVLSVSGRGIGGDLLNSRLVEAKLLDHFGAKTIINGKVEFPRSLLLSLTSWYKTTLLKNVKDIGTLQDLIVKSNQPEKVRNFLNLVINDYGFEFFRTVDSTKISLSEHPQTCFKFDRPNLSINENLTVKEFEDAIFYELEDTTACINEALQNAGVKSIDIDKVILTGGSAQVPIFINLIKSIFDETKLIYSDHFTSVAKGLGLRAKQIFE